jgi:hypothetical protein
VKVLFLSPRLSSQFQTQQAKNIADDDEGEWELIAEYATNHQQAIDAHEIVEHIYRHAENFMHESGTAMQPDNVGKPEDLYPGCLIGESQTCQQYACPMCYSCDRACSEVVIALSFGTQCPEFEPGLFHKA